MKRKFKGKIIDLKGRIENVGEELENVRSSEKKSKSMTIEETTVITPPERVRL